MALQCIVVRGLVREVEEELNKFLSAHQPLRVVHMTQSETGNHISLTLLYEESESPG